MGGWSLACVKQRNLKLTVCRLADLSAPRWIPGAPKATDIRRYRTSEDRRHDRQLWVMSVVFMLKWPDLFGPKIVILPGRGVTR